MLKHQYDYTYKPPKEQIQVTLLKHTENPYYASLNTELLESAQKNGFTFIKSDTDPISQEEKSLIKHLIILTEIGGSGETVRELFVRYQNYLNMFDTMSIAIVYPNSYAMQANKHCIEEFKL